MTSRYAIPESHDDSKYSITFTAVDKDRLDVWAMENDPEYRSLIIQQMNEAQELSVAHSMERVRHIVKLRRDRGPLRPEPQAGGAQRS